ncbi:FAS1-like dehydratase domain-containing protein [Burkholderia sp. Ac-20379]|uniref:FAS1-like dehydratase domain-containing protein n=1 Tax=Burkholderia sp. Ac-20379 TaxID=2703900 RepID=UPI00197D897D|nr:MaoC family dehydratase N-terminal domain-containing protein [Burkholderia sp. Ac-20379]MBN3722682.1 acyl-CoA dehydrogenase [Burkholderia sp. Ac-20379]
MDFDSTFENWTSRTEVLRERIDAGRLRALAATLDLSADIDDGAPLPAGWQWLFFNPIAPRSQLAEDGHPRRDQAGSFLPPVPLPRRMWAGSRIHYLRDLPVGVDATRTSRITKLANKEGRAGKLCFVTVEHVISVDGHDCIREEQDIVYREASSSNRVPEPAEDVLVDHRETIRADSTMLFRYSALTFNGHRIHHDAAYARDIEGYRGLVVQGPLTATLLQNFVCARRPDCRLEGFEFKGVNPLVADEAFELQAIATDERDVVNLRVLDASGALAMQATARFAAIKQEPAA